MTFFKRFKRRKYLLPTHSSVSTQNRLNRLKYSSKQKILSCCKFKFLKKGRVMQNFTIFEKATWQIFKISDFCLNFNKNTKINT